MILICDQCLLGVQMRRLFAPDRVRTLMTLLVWQTAATVAVLGLVLAVPVWRAWLHPGARDTLLGWMLFEVGLGLAIIWEAVTQGRRRSRPREWDG